MTPGFIPSMKIKGRPHQTRILDGAGLAAHSVQQTMWSDFSEPSPRWDHVSVGVEGKVYIYGGCTKDFWREKSSLASRVHIFNPCQESWQLDRRPEGTPPPGLIDAACTSIGHHAYIYRGFDGQNEHGVLHHAAEYQHSQLEGAINLWPWSHKEAYVRDDQL